MSVELFKKAMDLFALVSISDISGNILYANENFCKATGYSLDELTNNSHNILYSKFHEREFLNDLKNKINNKQIWRGEICSYTKEGKPFYVDTIILPHLDDNSDIEFFMNIHFDVSEKRILEIQLDSQLAEKFQMNKKVILGELATNLAHNINNPLTIIKGKINKLKKTIVKYISEDEQTQLQTETIFNTITKQTDHISIILQGLHEYNSTGKPLYLQKEKCNIIKETFKFIEKYKPQIQIQEINIISEISELELNAEIKSELLEQILSQLLVNSIYEIKNKNDKWIKIKIISEDEIIKLFFFDSGDGIDDEHKDKIFAPFFTTKRIGEGVGLGLTTALEIARNNGGTLYLDQGAENTCFVLELKKFT